MGKTRTRAQWQNHPAALQLAETIDTEILEPLGELVPGSAVERTQAQVKSSQGAILAVLAGSDRVAARKTARVIVRLLWKGHVPASWWATDLGILVGGALPDGQLLVKEAAVALGVTSGTVQTLLGRGTLRYSTLPRPDSGQGRGDAKPMVDRSSVLARIARLSDRQDLWMGSSEGIEAGSFHKGLPKD